MSRTNIVCINCPKGCRITVETENDHIRNIAGYSCPIGEKYARDEFENPSRILPTTVRVINGVLPLVSVKTERPIAKGLLLDAMQEIAKIEVEAPVYLGQVVKENLLDTGVDLIATRTISPQRG